jgi:polysaccharide export outer membrane protein
MQRVQSKEWNMLSQVISRSSSFALALALTCAAPVAAEQQTAQGPKASPTAAPGGAKPTAPALPAVAVVPPGYVIGVDDVLAVLFWREKDLSGDVVVRPDGKITLPLLNDVQAAGLTPEDLRVALTTAATKYVAEPNVTVVVRQINSRRVFITGQIGKPGPYTVTPGLTVMQLIALAGGLTEFADSKNIIIMRTENGKPLAYRFNYKEVLDRKKLQQNIELKPGDTVVVK